MSRGDEDVEFRVLGPLEIRHDGLPIHLTSDHEKRLLAALLVMPNRVVTLAHLVDAVWGNDPPASAKRQVQNRLSALRGRLSAAGASGLIVAEGPGYRICVSDEQVDAIRFQTLGEQARRLMLTHPAESARLWRTALGLWRGPALAGLTGIALEASAVRLDEQQLAGYEEYFDLQLRLGRPREVVGELSEQVALHPTREPLVGQLMLALHRSGRRAEALQVFHRLRTALAVDLGIDPSDRLQRLHTAILRGEATDSGILDQSPAAVTRRHQPLRRSAARIAPPGRAPGAR